MAMRTARLNIGLQPGKSQGGILKSGKGKERSKLRSKDAIWLVSCRPLGC